MVTSSAHSVRFLLQPVSQYPPCSNDLSVWLPESGYSAADFYDLVRSVGGDMVEQVSRPSLPW